MHKIPDEILLRIFTMLVNDVESLIKVGQVNKRFHRYLFEYFAGGFHV